MHHCWSTRLHMHRSYSALPSLLYICLRVRTCVCGLAYTSFHPKCPENANAWTWNPLAHVPAFLYTLNATEIAASSCFYINTMPTGSDIAWTLVGSTCNQAWHAVHCLDYMHLRWSLTYFTVYFTIYLLFLYMFKADTTTQLSSSICAREMEQWNWFACVNAKPII